MNRLNANDLEEQIAFARRAAECFATAPKSMSYSEHPHEPGECTEPDRGDWFAMRGECCVITFKIDEAVPVTMWTDALLDAEAKVARESPDSLWPKDLTERTKPPCHLRLPGGRTACGAQCHESWSTRTATAITCAACLESWPISKGLSARHIVL